MFEYRAIVLRIHDADTLTVLVDVGFSVRVEQDIRLVGVYAPELSDPGGRESREFTARWVLGLNPILRWPVVLRTLPNTVKEPTEKRSFTRYLGEIEDAARPERNLCVELAQFLAGHPEWGPGQTTTDPSRGR